MFYCYRSYPKVVSRVNNDTYHRSTGHKIPTLPICRLKITSSSFLEGKKKGMGIDLTYKLSLASRIR